MEGNKVQYNTFISVLTVFLQVVALNPKPFLAELTGKKVVVKLKWCQEYVGNIPPDLQFCLIFQRFVIIFRLLHELTSIIFVL